MEALTPVAGDLHDLLERHAVADVDDPADEARRLTANISTVVERFDRTLKTFNETFGDPNVKEGWLELFDNVTQMSVDGRDALQNINKITADLRLDIKRISDKVESGVDDTTGHINEMATQFRPILENTAQLTSALLRLAYALELGEGTAGMVLKDPRLYESLLLSSQRLTDMLETLERLLSKFERDGAIGVKGITPLGGFRRDIPIPQSSGR